MGDVFITCTLAATACSGCNDALGRTAFQGVSAAGSNICTLMLAQIVHQVLAALSYPGAADLLLFMLALWTECSLTMSMTRQHVQQICPNQKTPADIQQNMQAILRPQLSSH